MVVPTVKQSSRFDTPIHRLVSLTSVFCKSLERITVSHLTCDLDSNQLLFSEQVVLGKIYSTSDQLVATCNDIVSHVVRGKIVDSILYCKAFEVVCHIILLQKFLELGIDGTYLSWFSGFLNNCTMQAEIANY